MSDTTQETVVETPTDAVVDGASEDKVEATETEGVEQEVQPTDDQQPQEESPKETEEAGPTEEELEKEAEESLWETLKSQKGWESEEDVAKAYSELEKSFSRKAQDYAQLEKLTDALLSDEDAAVESGDITESEKKIAMLEARDDLRSVSDKYNDFSDYAEAMEKIITDAPNPSVFKGAKGVELLYKLAKVESQDSVVAQARAEGKKEATEKEIEKIRAQVASGTKAKRPESKAFTLEEINRRTQDNDVEWINANMKEIERQMKAGLIE